VGLKHLHSANVIHRDVKPSNLLLNADCSLKLCDFGLARGVETTESPDLTEYVVTRWYRAPEIMLSCMQYSKSIDVWSVGCVFAELLGTKPLFPGDDYIHQLKLIVDVLGSPSEEDLAFVKSPRALSFMQKQGGKAKVPFTTLFPRASPLSLDLLEKMLAFNPDKRITVDEALAHPYLSSLHSEEDEPVCPTPFDFSFETTAGQAPLDKPALQRLMLEQIEAYHPGTLPPAAAAAALGGDVAFEGGGGGGGGGALRPPLGVPAPASVAAAAAAPPSTEVTMQGPGEGTSQGRPRD
jgi:serine/threonine protein kinase